MHAVSLFIYLSIYFRKSWDETKQGEGGEEKVRKEEGKCKGKKLVVRNVTGKGNARWFRNL